MIYILSKLFTYTLLPPALFIWGFVLLAFKKIRILALGLALLLWFCSTQIGAHLLMGPLESTLFPPPKDTPRMIVVLGGGEDTGKLFPTQSGATERILAGLLLAKRDHLPMLVSGVEAKKAKSTIDNLLHGFGLDIDVYYEPKSLNTYQNAKYTAQMTKTRSIYLVTSAFHMPRAYKIFRSFGFDVAPIKTDYRTTPYTAWAFFPSMGNLQTSYLALHEYFGLLSLWFHHI